MQFSYLAPLIIFGLDLILVGIWRHLARNLQIVDVPGGSLKLHQRVTPYLGGVAIFIGFWAGLWALDCIEWNIFLPGTALLLVVGLLDDLFALTPWQKLIGQIVSAALLVIAGAIINLSLPGSVSLLISFAWLVVLMNAFNLVDVMDGLAGTLALGPLVAFLCLSLYLQQISVLIASLALILALVAFLFYNFPPATIYLGDTGSMFIGAVLGVISLRIDWLAIGGRVLSDWEIAFILFILFTIPLTELSSLILIRYLKKIPFYRGSRDHFSHYLQAQNWSVGQILGLVGLMEILLLILAGLFCGGTISLLVAGLKGLILLGLWLYVIFATKILSK
jgi:UDP-GlcNAc:undecaprenyl-phosphate GlcNAc-1-phosphate transferase